jgi:hypothetical protein
MKRRYFFVIGLLSVCMLLLFGVVGWMWYSRMSPQAFRVVALGSTKSNDRIKLSGGNLVVVAPRPGLLFGTVKRPGEEEHFTYVIQFPHTVSRPIRVAVAPRIVAELFFIVAEGIRPHCNSLPFKLAEVVSISAAWDFGKAAPSWMVERAS